MKVQSTQKWYDECSILVGERSIEGIQYVINESGKKTAVIISLEVWGELWEDFYDAMVSKLRKDEVTVAWDELKAEIDNSTYFPRR